MNLAAGLLAVVVVAPLLLVVPLLVGLLAWFLSRPADGEPPARARLRRGTGTTAAVATTVSVLLLLPAAAVSLGSPAAGAGAVLLAALLHVVTLWVGDSLTARPHAGHRSALLVPERRGAVRTALLGVVGAAGSGVLVVLGLAVSGVLPERSGLSRAVPPGLALGLLVSSALLAGLLLLALRRVERRPSDPRLDPLVDAVGRARAAHRLLRTGAGTSAAVLGLLLLGAGPLAGRMDGPGGGAADGGTAGTVALVAAVVALLLAAVVSLLPAPALPVRPDRADGPGAPGGSPAGAGAGRPAGAETGPGAGGA